jgi:SAM-dependent methyltransferase
MTESIPTCERWFEHSYQQDGFSAQRRYPNEEFLRFMGRKFFKIPNESRMNICILEIGCGSCANLWVVSKEGFSASGLDLSEEAIRLGDQMVKNWGGVGAELKVGSMTKIPWEDSWFDAVVDVFSAYCLNENDFQFCAREVKRVLKPGGSFFSFTPGKGSEAF